MLQRRQFDEQVSQLGKLAERQARESIVHDADLARGWWRPWRSSVLAARDELLARHTSRRDAAELRALQEHDAVQVLQARLDRALELIDTMQAESNAVEEDAIAVTVAVTTGSHPRSCRHRSRAARRATVR